MELDTVAIKHFADVAERGASPAASTGERVANRLAVALFHIGDDFALLDPLVIQGAGHLAAAMASAADDLKPGVFAIVRRAAGKKPAKR